MNNIKGKIKILLPYLISLILCIGILYFSFKLWKIDLRIPMGYYSDYLYFLAQTKAMIDNEWILSNTYLGMPFGNLQFDYPSSDNLNNLMIKVATIGSSDPSLLTNSVYLFTFPLTTVITVFVLKRLKISSVNSIMGALIYTFIPYHFRIMDLSTTYYLIPLIILVFLWIYSGELKREVNEKGLYNSKFIICVISCILISLNFFYFAFFACFFLILICLSSLITEKGKHGFYLSFLFILVILVGCVINISPSLIYQYESGHNQVSDRPPSDSEVYGLKVIQLLLPNADHRIHKLKLFNDRYSTTAPLVNENHWVSLGFIGCIGFLFLLVWVFFHDRMILTPAISEISRYYLTCLSYLNIYSVLFATIGGFGALVAYTILPQIRGYNRIVVFIAFFSIVTVMILLDYFKNNFFKTEKLKYVYIVGLVFLLLFSIIDMTPSNPTNYESIKKEYLNDKEFFSGLEKSNSNISMVFQLPFISYITWTEKNKMQYFDELKPYVHSKKIKWSYGGMYGRKSDYWNREISSLPLDQMLNNISIAGFDGLLVDTYGYSDDGKEEISEIQKFIHSKPIIDNNNRYYFFNLSEYSNKLKSKINSTVWSKHKDEILNFNLLPEWVSGLGWLGVSEIDGISTVPLGIQNGTQKIFMNEDKTVNLSFRARCFENNMLMKIYVNNNLVKVFNLSTTYSNCSADFFLNKGMNVVVFDPIIDTQGKSNTDLSLAIQHYKCKVIEQ